MVPHRVAEDLRVLREAAKILSYYHRVATAASPTEISNHIERHYGMATEEAKSHGKKERSSDDR